MGAAKSLIEGLLMPRRTPERGPAGRRRQSKIGARFGNGQSDGLRNVPISRPRAGRDSRRRASRLRYAARDRQSVVQGKSVSVRVDPGGRRFVKKNKHPNTTPN